MKILLPLLLLFFTFQTAKADDKWNLNIPKDSTVVLKCSSSYFDFKQVAVWSGRSIYSAEIGKADNAGNALTINGETNWKDSGWAWMRELILKKVSRDKKKTVVELRTGNASVKLNLAPEITDINNALNELLFVGNVDLFEDSPYYKTEIADRFLPRIFSGNLAQLPRKTQLKLIEAAKFNIDAIGNEKFKGKNYVVVRSDDDVQYNTIQVNQSERTSRTIEKMINFGLSNSSDVFAVNGIDGIKIEFNVFYRDFLREAVANTDKVNAYFIFDNLRQFKEADITNQQLIDNSIILVNGNRVQVSLTQFK